MEILTWRYPCLFCQRPIKRGRPTLIFSLDEPQLVGISHSMCAHNGTTYGRLQMCPPHYLTREEVSFLLCYFPKLFSLPGGTKQNSELRLALSRLIDDFPQSMSDIIHILRPVMALKGNKSGNMRKYIGDLEADFLRLLADLKQSAETIEGYDIDFR